MFANFTTLRNSLTFPAAYLFMSGKEQFYQGTNFGDSRTFPHAKSLELQIHKLFDTHKYPLTVYVVRLYYYYY